jgi:hypothetical protein
VPDTAFFEINKMLAVSYLQSFNKQTREFFSEGLPSCHEMAEELFPVFMDVDDIPVQSTIQHVKALCTALCSAIGKHALEIPEGAVISLYTNNPDWIIHSEEWLPRSKAVPEKYGVHIYFNENEDGKRPLSVAPIMYGVTNWLNHLLEAKCQVHREGTRAERKKIHKDCLMCHSIVDAPLFNKGLRPKLRMAYCDKGHPYNNHYYGLFYRLRWDGQAVSLFFFFFFLTFFLIIIKKNKLSAYPSRWQRTT